jgi:nitroreductase
VIATVPVLDLSVDELLTTTRAVRKRLDLTRPVEPEVIRECLELAVQAPTPGGAQDWHFIVVTEAWKREALAGLYRRTAHAPGGQDDILAEMIASAADANEAEAMRRKMAPTMHLTEHLHEVPVHIIPCIEGRAEYLPPI